MSVEYLISQLVDKTGADKTTDRNYLLQIINRAAKEIYEQDDYPGSLYEVVLSVLPNSLVALPEYIGYLRAVRSYNYLDKISLRTEHPRYSHSPWIEKWNKWRVKGSRAIQDDITSSSQLTLTIATADNTVVEIVGKTANANRYAESVTMDATSKTTTGQFTDIYSIGKKEFNNYDITIKDINNVVLAKLLNDQLRSRYTIIDISDYPGAYNSDGTSYMEVLYKPTLYKLYLNQHEFPLENFDDAIICKCMEIWLGEQDKLDAAMAWGIKCQQLIKKIIENIQGPIEKTLDVAPNPYYDLVVQGRVIRPKYLT